MIYIGKREYKYGRMIMSHMAADSLEELHYMAFVLGINRKHFQDKKGMPHYDICKSKKRSALGLDALKPLVKEVDDREIIKLFNEIK